MPAAQVRWFLSFITFSDKIFIKAIHTNNESISQDSMISKSSKELCSAKVKGYDIQIREDMKEIRVDMKDICPCTHESQL